MSSVENSSNPNSAQKKLKQRSILSMFGITASPGNQKSEKQDDEASKKSEVSEKEVSSPVGKQPRLPFQNISSTTTPVSSKKRKLSSDAEDRSSKIVRTSESKENIADCADSKDSEDKDTPLNDTLNDDVLEISSDSETETKKESTLLIKLPSSSKSKSRKQLLTDSIPKSHPKDEAADEDSVIYLDEEEIRKSCKKKKKTGDKRKKAGKIKKSLELAGEEKEVESDEEPKKKVAKKSEETAKPEVSGNEESSEKPEKLEESFKSKDIEDVQQKSPTESSEPEKFLEKSPEILESNKKSDVEVMEISSTDDSKIEESKDPELAEKPENDKEEIKIPEKPKGSRKSAAPRRSTRKTETPGKAKEVKETPKSGKKKGNSKDSSSDVSQSDKSLETSEITAKSSQEDPKATKKSEETAKKLDNSEKSENSVEKMEESGKLESSGAKSDDSSKKLEKTGTSGENSEKKLEHSKNISEISEKLEESGKKSGNTSKIQELMDSSRSDTSGNEKTASQELIELLSDSEENKTSSPLESSTPRIKIAGTEGSATKKLTPKQLKRKQDLEKIRLEKERQKQKEREEREELKRKEREEKEEQKRKEREEKEEQRRKEKEERELKRLQELDEKKKKDEQRELERKKREELKEQERLKKEEERLKKEEERKKKEQEKEDALKKKEQEKQEEEDKKKKAAQAFTKFFVVQKKTRDQKMSDDENSVESSETTESVHKLAFMPFMIKENMRMAPTVRSQLSRDRLSVLEKVLKGEEAGDGLTYLKQLKKADYKPGKSVKTWPVDEDECQIVEADELALVGTDIEQESEKLKIKHRPKLFLFSENQRPPYWGTWSKKTKFIGPRKPFGQDPKFFDYEVDSDDEWEEEEPGESLHGSDDEKDKDSEGEDYEVDNEFFVPHGHLSDEELRQQDEDEEDNSPETQKAKLKILQQEFAAEMKKKTEKIKPRLIGCIWMTGEEDVNGGFETLEDNEKKYHCSDIIWRILKAREMMCIEEEISLAEPIIEEPPEEVPVAQTPTQPANKRIKISNESVKELITLLHGNLNNKKFLAKEFQAYRLKKYGNEENFTEFLSISILEKINEIAVYQSCREMGPMFGKKCWIVKPEVMKDYFAQEQEPKLPNEWEYTLEKKKKVKEDKEDQEKSPESGSGKVELGKSKDAKKLKEEAGKSKEEPIKSSIVKYTVDLTEDEKRQQISAASAKDESKKPANTTVDKEKKPGTPQTAQAPPKKRVQLLMSVPRGQQIPEAKKNNLISQYLKTKQEATGKGEQKPEQMDVDDDVIVLD